MGEAIGIGLDVLGDWHVIFILILMIVFISLANYVIKYRKKPRMPKVKPAPVSAPAAEGEKKPEGEASAENEAAAK